MPSPTDPGTLLIRTDANATHGTGHAMRMMALSQAWRQKGGRSVVYTASMLPSVQKRLEPHASIHGHEGGEPVVEGFTEFAQELGPSWIAMDGYHLADHQGPAAGLADTMVVDDHGMLPTAEATIIVDPNVGADAARYAAPSVLAGPQYAMLRHEFWTASPSNGDGVLVNLGGIADSDALASLVTELRRISKRHLHVVGQKGLLGPDVHSHGLVEDMPNIMRQCAWAFTAGGTTCLELAALAIPAIIVSIADNQDLVGPSFQAAEAGIAAGSLAEIPPRDLADFVGRMERNRSRLSAEAHRLVVGQGAHRVVAHMLQQPLTR